MKRNDAAYLFFLIVGCVLFVIGTIGWVLNIFVVANSNEITGMLIVRVVGIFIAPLGAILGFI